MLTNADITIYNVFYDSEQDKDIYQRTAIKGVHFEENKAVRLDKGLVTDDKVLICIPFLAEASRMYVDPMMFDKMSVKEGYFTLKEGDRIVKGIQDYEVQRSMKELDEQFEAFTITNVDTCDYGSVFMRHWEVGCK